VVVELHGVKRKLVEGLSWCGEGWGELPTTASGSPEWRKGAAVVFEARGARGKGKGGEWVEYYLLVLLGRRGKEEEQAQARDTVAVMWRPVGARVAVALAEEDSRGGKQDRGRGRATHGIRPSSRWRRGGVRAAVGGADSRWQREAEEQRGARGGRRERGGPRDSFTKIESPGTSL
jgi:hypothetical protein